MNGLNRLSTQLSQQEMAQISGGKKTCYGFAGYSYNEIECQPATPGYACYEQITNYIVYECKNNGKIIKQIGTDSQFDSTIISPN
jgi:uncharacterized membrane protein